MTDIDRAALKALQRGRDWLWIAGNHDPDPADDIGGRFAEMLALGAADIPPRAVAAAHATARSPAICIRWRASRGAAAP